MKNRLSGCFRFTTWEERESAVLPWWIWFRDIGVPAALVVSTEFYRPKYAVIRAGVERLEKDARDKDIDSEKIQVLRACHGFEIKWEREEILHWAAKTNGRAPALSTGS